jgi:hypothetical protein
MNSSKTAPITMGAVFLICISNAATKGTVVVYNVIGQPLEIIPAELNKGINVIDIPTNSSLKNSVIVVSFYVNNLLTFTQKAIQ